jgi:acetyl esterase/lipase
MKNQRIDYGCNPRQVLDVYKPQGSIRVPAIVYIHGGAWISSSIDEFRDIGVNLSQRGFICILCEYRLTDKATKSVVHPEHCMDVCRGIEHSVRILSDDSQWDGTIVLAGHSAGAYMTGFPLIIGGLSKETLERLIGWIGIEGIYDIDRIAEMYPSYVDWFLIHAFPDQKGWNQLTLFSDLLTDVPIVIMHSKDDELVDWKHAKEFSAYHQQTRNVYWKELFGTHDGVLSTVEFYDAVDEVVRKYMMCT